MAQQNINLGTGELAGDGESLRSALEKIENNFTELYSNNTGISLTDISVTSLPASAGGALTYNNTTGVLSYTPADLSAYTVTESDVIAHRSAMLSSGVKILNWSTLDGRISTDPLNPTVLNISEYTTYILTGSANQIMYASLPAGEYTGQLIRFINQDKGGIVPKVWLTLDYFNSTTQTVETTANLGISSTRWLIWEGSAWYTWIDQT